MKSLILRFGFENLYIPLFSTLYDPLTRMTQKTCPLIGKEGCKEPYNCLKYRLTLASISV